MGVLSDLIGTRATAAQTMGASPAALQRYINGSNMPPFDVAARLCLTTGANMHWLATGMGEMLLEDERKRFASVDSQELSDEHLTIALELADRAIGVGYLPRPLYARLVRLLYEGVIGGLPVAQIEQIASAAARSLAQGGKTNDGESRVGAAGRAGAVGGGDKASRKGGG